MTTAVLDSGPSGLTAIYLSLASVTIQPPFPLPATVDDLPTRDIFILTIEL